MSALLATAFINRHAQLRNGWWLVVFFALLAALLFPLIFISARSGRPVGIWAQVALIGAATWIVQSLRRRPFTEVTGTPSRRTAPNVLWGSCSGALLMLAPAAVLWALGAIALVPALASPASLGAALLTMAGVAVAEELLFRGVLFQRLREGVGHWPAQLLIAGIFVLTHLDNPGMEGTTKILAGLNIFIASIVFGEAMRATNGLAMPIALHFMANTIQGVLLGFGVSGNDEASLLQVQYLSSQVWLTVGTFGLEASAVGLIAISITLLALVGRRPPDAQEPT